ncbi:MAG TPA: acetolactate synthase large subunit, partial [Candidatus Nesterenkonia stercoripullorum]|nr:acetolactate synthase large subunit [Candidatus Nesterenkonia stercoripullorum]
GFEDYGMTFTNPDFVTYAEAFGATGRRVERAEDLATTLEEAFAAGGVQVVVVPVDYSENTRVLIDELNEREPLARLGSPS